MITKENARLEALRLAAYNEASGEATVTKAELFYQFLIKDGTCEAVKRTPIKKE